MNEITSNLPNIDNNILTSISPLLCIYKKSSPKIITIKEKSSWDPSTFKEDLSADANVFLTLSLIHLSNFYKRFEGQDQNKFDFSLLYHVISKRQLEFFAMELRNEDGAFIDKKVALLEEYPKELKLVKDEKSFRYSIQAFFMIAYYKCFLLDEDNLPEYKDFAKEILNMLFSERNGIYKSSLDDLLKLNLALNIYYEDSKLPELEALILDTLDICYERNVSFDLESSAYCLINSILAYRNTGLIKFKDKAIEFFKKLSLYYDQETNCLKNKAEEKEFKLYSTDIMLFISSSLLYYYYIDNTKANLVSAFFKNIVLQSGIILSWPDPPNLEDVEKYRNLVINSEALLEDVYFKMDSIPSPELAEVSPIFIKYVTYNKKRNSFKPGKDSFDSSKNMFIYYLLLYIDSII